MSDTFVDDVASGSSPDSGTQDPALSQGQVDDQGGASGDTGDDGGQHIPRHRFNEVIEQRRQWEARATEIYQHNQELQRQLMELAKQGRQPAQPQQTSDVDPVTKKVRDQILQVLPELKRILELNPDALAEAGKAVPAFQEAQKLQWNMRGAEAMRELNTAVEQTFKGQKVPDANKRFFHAAFVDWLDVDQGRQERYMNGEGAILAREFWNLYNAQVLQPLRRGAAVEVTAQGRRVAGLPRQGSTTGVVPGNRPAQPKTPDELHDAAWDALQQRLSGG